MLGDTILTHFWVDNFDMNTEKMGGSGDINTTHLVEFQEISEQSVECKPMVLVPNLKRRTLVPSVDDLLLPEAVVIRKQEPPQIAQIQDSPTFDDGIILTKSLIWLYIRKQNSFDQIVSSFPGWLVEYRKSYTNVVVKTVETYLQKSDRKSNNYKIP